MRVKPRELEKAAQPDPLRGFFANSEREYYQRLRPPPRVSLPPPPPPPLFRLV